MLFEQRMNEAKQLVGGEFRVADDQEIEMHFLMVSVQDTGDPVGNNIAIPVLTPAAIRVRHKLSCMSHQRILLEEEVKEGYDSFRINMSVCFGIEESIVLACTFVCNAKQVNIQTKSFRYPIRLTFLP